MKIRLLLVMSLVLLGLSACGDFEGIGDIDFLPGDPLIGAADLAAAPILEATPPEEDPELVLEGDAQTVSLQEFTQRANTGASLTSGLSTQSSTELSSEGFVSYLQVFDTTYRLQLYDPAAKTTTLIYEGANVLQSAAVTADGSVIAFTAELNGNSEVFAFDITGDVLGAPETLVRLTDTSYDEKDVALSSGVSAVAPLQGVLTLVWQGLLELEGSSVETVVFSRFDLTSGELVSVNPIVVNADAGPLTLREPSVSAGGDIIVFVTNVGTDTLGTFTFNPNTGDSAALILQAPANTSFSSPSVSADGSAYAALANDTSGVQAVYFDDESEGIEMLNEAAQEHPFLNATADGYVYSDDKDVFLSELEGESKSITSGLVYRSFGAYWAKLPFVGSSLTYEGVNDEGPFVRQPDDGLSEEARTVLYDAKTFSVAEAGWYEIVSVQTYDGYLNLYEAPFDPEQPEENLLTSNDDIDTAPRKSGVIFELEAGTEYVIVTSACGNESCGEAEGSFVNTVTPSDPPPEPDTLPEPDNSGFDITLRFAQNEETNSLTEEQRAVFEEAADRWAEIITGDLQNIENFELPPNPFDGFGAIENQVVDDVLIDLRFTNIDGPSNILGRAGPRIVREEGDSDEFLTIYGQMEFDISEFGDGGFFDDAQAYRDTILHEMGHVLGIGTFPWRATGVTEGIIDENPPTVSPGLPNPDYDPRFIGAGAIAEYQSYLAEAGRESEASVPIANTGGPGSINGHWRELTFADELMTPFAGGREILSTMTAASLGDLGYTVDLSAAEAYSLPIPAEFRLISPEEKTYAEFEDYLVASGSADANLSATVQAVDINVEGDRANTSGCEPEDFADFTAGNIALIQRGTCPFAIKVENAETAGAVGTVIFNQGNESSSPNDDRLGPIGSLGLGSYEPAGPVLGASFDLGLELAGFDAPEVFINTGIEAGDVATQALPGFGFNIGEAEILLTPEAFMSPEGKLKPLD